ncbi:MAG: peptidyl-prolyl cis-trans isomerase [Acidobacteria bacterium]|nr:peptidyl-prolyl cis-trans isomerase [Acidobacteriota bacterium]MCI0626168.1 peptidyl-prolyl cis-trans isomerase [Acidobacteriota bacterium]MCI0718734.1 peptidyl-prolyl cis-trans isomerase [Acidobacteriota bacterium]
MILDLMRREKKKFLGILLVPLVFGLVAYLIPGMPGGAWGGGLGASVLATVGGAEISSSEFIGSYQRFLRSGQFPYDRQFLKTLQIDRQILNQLVSREIILAEARRLGLDATANELQQRIFALPYFQDNGNFAFSRYKTILEQNGMTVQQFEDGVREEIVQEKLRNLITDSVTISEKEVEDEYRNRNEKAKISYVSFEPAKFTAAVVLQEAGIRAYYDQNKESYRVAEQRKAKYLFADTAALRSGIQIPESEMRSYYQQNLSTYQLPEKVRASHILLKTEGKSAEEVEKIKAKAADLLLQVRKGGDFADLAKKNSEDPVSAANGGDLGPFGRGAMVPEFDQAAFTLGVGAISDLVKTQFGFHIIKVLEKQPAHTQTFEEVVENLIRPTLLQRKAEQRAQELADKAFTLTKNNKSLEQIAAELKISVQETPLFLQGASIPLIGNSAEFSSKVFGLKDKEVGSPTRIPNGFALPQLVEIKAPYVPSLDEVRSRVEDALKASKASDLAKAKAQEFAEKAKSAGALEKLAKSYSVEIKTSEEFTRNGSLQDLGSSSPFDSFAFSSEQGSISQPIEVGQRHVIAQLMERKPISPEEFAKAKDSLRQSLLTPKKDRLFQAYVDSVRETMTKAGSIKIDEAEFASLSRRM